MFLGLMGRQGSACLRWGGLLTHSKCFLIFSDSAYLEIPLMKRVRLTCGRGQQACLSAGGLQESQRMQGEAGSGVSRGAGGWEQASETC